MNSEESLEKEIATLLKKHGKTECKHVRCMCVCHHTQSVKHRMPCCFNCPKCGARNVR